MKQLLSLQIALVLLFSSCEKEFISMEESSRTSNNLILKSTYQYKTNWVQISGGDEFEYYGSPNPSIWQNGPWFKYRFRFPDKQGDTTWGFIAYTPEIFFPEGGFGLYNLTNCWYVPGRIVTWSIPAYVDGHCLVIETKHDVLAQNGRLCDFATGSVQANNPIQYKYIEIKADLPAGNIIGAAFGLEGLDDINVFESDGWRPYYLPTNIHKVVLDSTISFPDQIKMPYALTGGWHIYGLEWAPNHVNWYVDNKLVRTFWESQYIGSAPKKINFGCNVPPASYYLSTATINNEALLNKPFEDYIIEYIRIYDKRPTTALFLNIIDNSPILSELSNYSVESWDLDWEIVVPGKFNNDSFTDLLLYNKLEGKALCVKTNGEGDIVTIREFLGWRKTWHQIIAGNFGGSGLSDLLLYDNTTGELHFVSIDGSFSSVTTISGISKSLKIFKGNFDGRGYDDLLFYDTSSGAANFYSVSSLNSLKLIKACTGWRKTWDIIPGDFGGSSLTDLLLYDKHGYDNQMGEGFYFSVDGSFSSTSSMTPWRKTWKIIAGNFNTSTLKDDLLFYDTANNGHAYFFTTSSTGIINQYGYYENWNPSWDILVPGQFSNTSNTDLLLIDR